MKYLFFLLLSGLCLTASYGQQQATFKVSTDKDIYFPGDSVHWQCELNGFGRRFNAVTLQLWIENVRNHEKWQYRFPVINGYAEGAMRIGAIPPGRYAFNFLLQADFFNIEGKVSRPRAKDTTINYLAIFKDKETIINSVKMQPDGGFYIGGLVFQDTAMFTFSNVKKSDPPSVKITTSLDSAFTPVIDPLTRFISIVNTDGAARDTGSTVLSDAQLSKDYHFDIRSDIRRQQLAEVVIKDRKSNKLLKEYQDAYVTTPFKTADDITLDGLSNDDILQSGNLYNYLMMHVPGLTANMNPETGVQEFKWRNSHVAVYLDEFRLPDDSPIPVSPGEVAVIKVFRPGSGPLTGGSNNSAAIAIYTKVGPYSRFLPASEQRNRFYVHGYDGISIEWRN